MNYKNCFYVLFFTLVFPFQSVIGQYNRDSMKKMALRSYSGRTIQVHFYVYKNKSRIDFTHSISDLYFIINKQKIIPQTFINAFQLPDLQDQDTVEFCFQYRRHQHKHKLPTKFFINANMDIEIPGIPIWGNGLFRALKYRSKVNNIYGYPQCGISNLKFNNNDSNDKVLQNIPIHFEIENKTTKINFSNELNFYLSRYEAFWEYQPIVYSDSFRAPNFYDSSKIPNPDAIFVYQNYNYRFCNIDRKYFKEPWKIVIPPGQKLRKAQKSAQLIFFNSKDTLSAIVTNRISPKRLKLD